MRFKGISVREDHLLAALIVVVSTASFVLGRMSVDEKSDAAIPEKAVDAAERVEKSGEPAPYVSNEAATPIAGGYVASKSGTRYHLPWCAGAKQIKDENKIWFATKEEAEKAGYAPAANCKGL